MQLSVIICTYKPAEEAYRRTLEALSFQTLDRSQWELLIVDNNSPVPSSQPGHFKNSLSPRLFTERQSGQAHARRLGLRECHGDLVVFVDQDNVLSPDYLAQVVTLFTQYPEVGLAGGKSIPEFEIPPESWTREFWPLLALRDHGNSISIIRDLKPPGASHNQYPMEAPHGAGLCGRKAAFATWLNLGNDEFTGRTDGAMTSGEDNDIVLCAMEAGWAVAYFPSLSLKHLIPPDRLTPEYLERINHGIQKSWLEVLGLHNASPWAPIPAWSLIPRKIKAWFACMAWRGPAERIRWRGACGHFEGRVK